jgi:ribonucleoside-diphosphate reductase alpha chain
MWRRVADAIAAVEEPSVARYWGDKFYAAMAGFKFVPAGRILSGAGTGFQVTYFNCYVTPPPEDSRDGILDNLKIHAEIQARGGGVGVNLSTLRRAAPTSRRSTAPRPARSTGPNSTPTSPAR